MKDYKAWLEKYYPIYAADVAKEDALAHSHQKWLGLRPAVLAEYGMFIVERIHVTDGSHRYLRIGADSCALCEYYNHAQEDDKGWRAVCQECPLAKVRDGVPCDQASAEDEDSYLEEDGWDCAVTLSPYGEFRANQNPEPMIALIEKAISDMSEKEAA